MDLLWQVDFAKRKLAGSHPADVMISELQVRPPYGKG